jgi:hypothetical protein
MSSQYSDDQYSADYESRYPDFSDYQNDDKGLAEHRWDRPAVSRGVRTFESKYQTEQVGLPTYLGCQCGKCPLSAWPRKPQMRRCTLDDREQAMQILEQRRCGVGCDDSAKAAPSKAEPTASTKPAAAAAGASTAVESMIGTYAPHDMDPATIMMVMMFIMFVFICYCVKSIIELKAQLKHQKISIAEK